MTIKTKLIAVATAPVLVPLAAIQLHNAGGQSKFEKDQQKRLNKIAKMNANRYNR
jgi:hypothetical protein